jgi:hypothetical protein
MKFSVWRGLLPGVCITVLAVEALLLTAMPSILDHRKVKFGAILIAFAFGIGEVMILRKDRKETLNQHTADMASIFDRFGRIDRTTEALLENYRAKELTAPGNSLRRRLLDLSAEMLKESVQFNGAELKVSLEFLYIAKYAARVAEIHEELKKRGLSSETLDRWVLAAAEQPNLYYITFIAEELTKIAKKLPE